MAMGQPPQYNFASTRPCFTTWKRWWEELNPEVWTKLPSGILEKDIISKLPFSSLAKFRLVSKHWCSVVIPFAARNGQTSRTVLLYFPNCCVTLVSKDVWCSQFSKVKSDPTYWEFPRHYIHPKEWAQDFYDEVFLVACEKGLLFYAMGYKKFISEIVVLNPLTQKSKGLHLPEFILHDGRHSIKCRIFLVGVVVDAETGNYELIIARVNKKCQYQTLLYDSSLDEWTHGPSFLPVLPEADRRKWMTTSNRSTCCNGNLYWFITDHADFLGGLNFVLKFEMQKKTWSAIPVDVDFPDNCKTVGCVQIAAYKDILLMWHGHQHPLHSNHIRLRGCSDEDEGHPNCKAEPSRSHLDMDPVLKVMPQEMIDAMESFVKRCEELDMSHDCQDYSAFSFGEMLFHMSRGMSLDCQNYFAFSDGDIFYHITHVHDEVYREEDDPFVRILVHDPKVNSYTELPIVKDQTICESCARIWLSDIWSFSASLISKP